MRVRLAATRDLATLRAIQLDANHTYTTVGVTLPPAAALTPVGRLQEGIDDGLLWVAEDDAGDVGFALALDRGASLHLEELHVVRARQRSGHGSRLVGAVENEARARGRASVTLVTVDFAPWTIGFYRAVGYRVLAFRELDAALRRDLWIVGERPTDDQRTFCGRIALSKALAPVRR